ncbi:MAG: prefoldin subunit alpha [Candidatus Aenigmatarchaeota archaeon]
MEDKALQEKIVAYQILQRYIEALSEQAVMLENRLLEINATQQAIEEFSKIESGNEIYVALGSGCWTLSRIERPKAILFNLGAGIYAERGIEDVKKALSERSKAIESEIERIQSEFNTLKERLSELAKDIGQAISP